MGNLGSLKSRSNSVLAMVLFTSVMLPTFQNCAGKMMPARAPATAAPVVTNSNTTDTIKGLQSTAPSLQPVVGTVAPQTYSRTLNGFTFTVSRLNGTILKIEHAQLGTLLQASEGDAGLFTFGYPLAEFLPNQIVARQSQLSQIIESTSSGLAGFKLVWLRTRALRPDVSLPEANIQLVVEITVAPNTANGILFKAWINNFERGKINQILFPDLAGFRANAFGRTTQDYRDLTIVSPGDTAPFKTQPFRKQDEQEDRAGFYASVDWQRIPLATARPWLSMGYCDLPRLYFEEVYADYGPASSSEIILQPEFMAADRLRMALRRVEPVQPGAREFTTPGVIMMVSTNAGACQ